MFNHYNENDLLLVIDLIFYFESKFNRYVDYTIGAFIADEYNKITGQNRNGGAMYMLCWRIKEGVYDSRYPSVAIARRKIS
ncbi:hypothetical protein OFR20_05605 [Brachyspira hyodysenteriae]|uniref:hypothetical protein n=1 Tax=Brachyspira hyodysenteriae TaxID=159 RepID=UPI0022CD438F|nr:hypothetical protein [Brachyspira hyodysenteriae]MCZ9980997.1 hypothetical protein [Brachyspira hyodysenteriae]